MSAPEPEHRRTHPITPLVTGWKVVVGLFAVILAQNVAQLLQEFTLRRALFGAGLLGVAIVLAIVFSALAWWRTTYAVSEEGVAIHSGIVSRSRQFAPRARIESVSVERPLLARLLGLAKVRIEVAGGGESHLDIEYIRSHDAEQLRLRILRVAAHGQAQASTRKTAPSVTATARPAGLPVTGEIGDGSIPVETQGGPQLSDHPHLPHTEPGTEPPAGPTGAAAALRVALADEAPDEGEMIAQVPATRLFHSLLRDADFLLGLVMSLVGVAAAVGLAFWQEGLSFALIIALLPTFIAVPKYVFGRIEAGWGFVSRISERGLRMRRGLANTRTDNIASGRIQRFQLRRPLLWRAPGWTAVTVTVAGIDESDENGAQNVLPVGTAPELRLTLGHLAAPLGTVDDLATIEHLLTTRARDLTGHRPPHRLFWIARRTQVTMLLPGAVIHRTGILARKLEIIPRDRIQQVVVADGPLNRKLGALDLKIGVAGHTAHLSALPRQAAQELHGALSQDAATRRRYRDRASWPQPALAGVGV